MDNLTTFLDHDIAIAIDQLPVLGFVGRRLRSDDDMLSVFLFGLRSKAIIATVRIVRPFAIECLASCG